MSSEGFLKIYDISLILEEKMAVYPGNPSFQLERVQNIIKDKLNLSKISLGLHIGTHLDAPLHHLSKGSSVIDIKLDRCIGWARVIDLDSLVKCISATDLKNKEINSKEIILLKTRNSKIRWRKKFNPNFVYLTEDGAKYLIKRKIKAVGIDGPSIKKFRQRPDKIHPLLFKNGVLIYEGLDLRNIKEGKYFFIGLPLKIRKGEASPVRACLLKFGDN